MTFITLRQINPIWRWGLPVYFTLKSQQSSTLVQQETQNCSPYFFTISPVSCRLAVIWCSVWRESQPLIPWVINVLAVGQLDRLLFSSLQFEQFNQIFCQKMCYKCSELVLFMIGVKCYMRLKSETVIHVWICSDIYKFIVFSCFLFRV